MDSVVTPEIIEAASNSNLGILSLMILVLGIITLTFFRKSHPRVQLLAFTPLFLGVVGFGYSVIGAESKIIDGTSPFDKTDVSISVVTGNTNNSGTNANVSVVLIGELGSSIYELDNTGDDRQVGKTDSYSLTSVPDIGPLREAIFQVHYNPNQRTLDDWLVSSIKVIDKNRNVSTFRDVEQWIGDSNAEAQFYKLNLKQNTL